MDKDWASRVETDMNPRKGTRRPPAPAETTVYSALPSLRALHEVDRRSFLDIKEPYFWEIFDKYKRFTCLGVERFYNIFKSIEYISKTNLSGDLAECGVFLGGSILAAGHFAEYFGLKNRKFYLFDTFQGFPKETVEKDFLGDVLDLSTIAVFNQNFRSIVEKNISESHLNPDMFVLVEGPVEDTLPDFHDVKLSYLRLDTDYYESTFVELSYLYPNLKAGGVIIVDDYGHFEGVRKAVDKYFEIIPEPLLHRIDYTGRCGVKI
jgi:O-methyltransferase